jgi:hypothetical protein
MQFAFGIVFGAGARRCRSRAWRTRAVNRRHATTIASYAPSSEIALPYAASVNALGPASKSIAGNAILSMAVSPRPSFPA